MQKRVDVQHDSNVSMSYVGVVCAKWTWNADLKAALAWALKVAALVSNARRAAASCVRACLHAEKQVAIVQLRVRATRDGIRALLSGITVRVYRRSICRCCGAQTHTYTYRGTRAPPQTTTGSEGQRRPGTCVSMCVCSPHMLSCWRNISR